MSCMEVTSWVAHPISSKFKEIQTKRSQASKRLIHIKNPSLKKLMVNECLIIRSCFFLLGASGVPSSVWHTILYIPWSKLIDWVQGLFFPINLTHHSDFRSIFMLSAVATCVWHQPASQPASQTASKQSILASKDLSILHTKTKPYY